jgi:hypothetical protein
MNKYEWIATVITIGVIGLALVARQYSGVGVGVLGLIAIANGFLREDE